MAQAIVRWFEVFCLTWLILQIICHSTCRDCGAPNMRGALCGSMECRRRRQLRWLEQDLFESQWDEINGEMWVIEPAVKVMGGC
jgi:hypothetical protein